MSISIYKINEGYNDARTVEAAHIKDSDVFVDFYDGTGLVLRLRRDNVHTVELKRNAGE